MFALLSGLGIKDIFYGVLIATALTWGGWTYHKYEAAVTYAADVKADSRRLLDNANAMIQAQDSDYAAKLAATQVTQDAQLKAASAQSADLAQRLRNNQAHRCSDAVLDSPAAAASSGAAGTGSVEQALEGVIAAAAHDHAVITAERAERDSLTGK